MLILESWDSPELPEAEVTAAELERLQLAGILMRCPAMTEAGLAAMVGLLLTRQSWRTPQVEAMLKMVSPVCRV